MRHKSSRRFLGISESGVGPGSAWHGLKTIINAAISLKTLSSITRDTKNELLFNDSVECGTSVPLSFGAEPPFRLSVLLTWMLRQRASLYHKKAAPPQRKSGTEVPQSKASTLRIHTRFQPFLPAGEKVADRLDRELRRCQIAGAVPGTFYLSALLGMSRSTDSLDTA